MPPVAVAAAGAAASIGGGILSANAQKKAANKAADTSLAVAQQNNALQREIYGQNKAILNPYAQRGNEAGNAINALLGIAGTNPSMGTGVQTVPTPVGAPIPADILAMRTDGIPRNFQDTIRTQYPNIWAMRSDGIPHNYQDAIAGLQSTPAPPPTATPTTPAPGATPLTTYQNAFQNYLNSTGYQFQVDQGNQAINQGYAAKGALQSGAALKALQTYGQNTATGFFKDYLGLLSNQQGVGLSGASAIAGVGQNYANNVGANNTAAGNAAANAQLAIGNANAGMWGNIAGGIGGLANAFASSYRPGG